ncbi:hypothetical protein SAMN02745723_10783 [Pragia fontium DSM 5563 = ATCC 49100]|uniref:Uncharacterized protein n=2 Tax=Pragia fontium TaxID=82985 RepID=A0AAJ4WBL0_9GAMM|nr:hypothetical protein SAMN02745723_10783 [Pragia fontium DSM 5563 = ATCC 49100]VEJ56204.1 Uncharacterised protein [Pragia fontium]
MVERPGGKALMLFIPSSCEDMAKQDCVSLYSLNLKNNKLNFVLNLGQWKITSVFSVNIPEQSMYVLSRYKSDIQQVSRYYYRALRFEVIESKKGVYIDFFPREPQVDIFNYCFDGVNETGTYAHIKMLNQ